jgi:hypothetical protein
MGFFSRKIADPLTRFAQSGYATATTPDMIIAAAIVDSFAKEFEAWTAKDLCRKSEYYKYPDLSPTLTNADKDIKIEFGVRSWRGDADGGDSNRSYHCKDWQSEGTKVNGIAIELRAARLIASSYEKLLLRRKALKEQEAASLAAMKRNEAAWNIAEKLLNMKRNEHGALVPVQQVEASCACVTEDGLSRCHGC